MGCSMLHVSVIWLLLSDRTLNETCLNKYSRIKCQLLGRYLQERHDFQRSGLRSVPLSPQQYQKGQLGQNLKGVQVQEVTAYVDEE